MTVEKLYGEKEKKKEKRREYRREPTSQPWCSDRWQCSMLLSTISTLS